MDNLTFDVPVKVDVSTLQSRLRQADVRLTRRSRSLKSPPQLQFSLGIGKWRARWLFRLDLDAHRLRCSGGVATVFFGHNVLVPRNEGRQLRLVVRLVCSELMQFGMAFPAQDDDSYTVKRVEITRTYMLPDGVDQGEALGRLFRALKAKVGRRAARQGNDSMYAGTIVVGLQKSKRALRIYDPNDKRKKVPQRIPIADWSKMFGFTHHCVRVESIHDARELRALGLDRIASWNDRQLIESAVSKRYRALGLTVAYRDEIDASFIAKLKRKHPTFMHYVQHWKSDGMKGGLPASNTGAKTRYKRFMLAHGHDVAVPYGKRNRLVHGLHDALDPARALPIPDDLWTTSLFRKWWIKP